MQNKKNVIYLLPYPGFFSQTGGTGGAVAHAYGILEGLSKKNFNIDIIVDKSHELLTKRFSNIIEIPSKTRNIFTRQYWGYKVLKQLESMIQTKEIEFCYSRYSAGFSLFFPKLKKILGNIPLILEVNSLSSTKNKWMKKIESNALHSADIIVCVSEQVRDQVLSITEKIDSKLLVVPNGVSINRFKYAKPNKIFEPDKINLGYTGLLNFNYGHECLINAIKEIAKVRKDIHLHFIGDGPNKKQLETMIELHDPITFHGSKPFLEMPGIIKSLDILVYTTSNFHVFQSPIKMFEYMASEKPIVAAKTPQTKALLGSEKRGLLYEIDNVEMLKKKIFELLDNPNACEILAQESLLEVEKKHTWEKRVEYILEHIY